MSICIYHFLTLKLKTYKKLYEVIYMINYSLLEESSNDQITLSKLTQIKEQLELERKVSFQID